MTGERVRAYLTVWAALAVVVISIAALVYGVMS